jgi:hypothetical protein
MSRRQLLGGAAILAVIATVLWYVVVAPSKGSAVQPDASVRVVLSATAAGSGTWVRYLVTVKNLADGDFAGDVLLLDRDLDSENPAPAAPPLTSLSRNPRIPTVPAVAGDSAYRVHLTVPSRHSRTIAILAPDFFTVVEAVMDGRSLDTQVVDHAAVLPVAVLSGADGPATAILELRYDSLTPRVAQFSSAAEFPSSALSLAGYAAVVVDQFDSGALDRAQVGALRDFVAFGGTLVLAAGSHWQRTIAPLPTELQPIRASATASVSLAPLAALAGAGAPARSVPAAVGPPAPGTHPLLDGPDGVPLVAELDYGAGKVVELAYDPSGEATGSPYTALGWSQASARSVDQPPGNGPLAASVLGADPGFTALLPAAGDAPLPPPWLLGLLLVLYVAVAGPLGYLAATRRWGRPGLFWLIVPAVAVACTGLFYVVGTALQGGLQDHEIQVVRVGMGSVNVLEYHRVLFLRRGNHQIVPAAGSLVAPLTLESYRTTGSTCERCTSQLGALPSGGEHVSPNLQDPAVAESGVVYGSVRVVAASGLDRAQTRLDARLTVQGGHVLGTITNRGDRPVYLLQAFTGDGQVLHRAALADALAPGAQVTFDSALGPADQAGRAATPESVLLRSVAADALSARGKVVLVGLMAPLPSRLKVDGQQPPTAALAVLEQAVRPDATDGSVRDLERKWLASSSGDQKSGFTDVYDLGLPAPSGPLTLVYSSQWSPSVEVYDWARGAFAPVAATPRADPTEAQVALTPDQVRDGMVRVRMHEPRPSWGATAWLAGPGG